MQFRQIICFQTTFFIMQKKGKEMKSSKLVTERAQSTKCSQESSTIDYLFIYLEIDWANNDKTNHNG